MRKSTLTELLITEKYILTYLIQTVLRGLDDFSKLKTLIKVRKNKNLKLLTLSILMSMSIL